MVKLVMKITNVSHKIVLQKKYVLDNNWMKIAKKIYQNSAVMVLHVLTINALR